MKTTRGPITAITVSFSARDNAWMAAAWDGSIGKPAAFNESGATLKEAALAIVARVDEFATAATRDAS